MYADMKCLSANQFLFYKWPGIGRACCSNHTELSALVIEHLLFLEINNNDLSASTVFSSEMSSTHHMRQFIKSHNFFSYNTKSVLCKSALIH